MIWNIFILRTIVKMPCDYTHGLIIDTLLYDEKVQLIYGFDAYRL